jgi:uncharacterized Zn finger protein
LREKAQTKARRYLTEGRVIVTDAGPGHVRATVRGDGTVWTCGFYAGAWRCSCPVTTDQCSHLHALRLVTAPDLAEHNR